MTALAILAVIAGVLGILGSVLPALPGPPLSWVGLLLAFLSHGTNAAGESMGTTFLLVWLGVTVAVTVLDYFIPLIFMKFTGGSKDANRGAIAGLIVGMVFPPIGILLGTLLGAFLADWLVAGREVRQSLRSAIGAFLGFIFGTGLKLTAAGIMFYYIIVYI